MRQIRFSFPGDPVPFYEITKKIRNCNSLENNGFKKDKNKVPGFNIMQLQESNTEQYCSL
jgi:hypothetical protein